MMSLEHFTALFINKKAASRVDLLLGHRSVAGRSGQTLGKHDASQRMKTASESGVLVRRHG